jgi:ABC-type transport system substrate-binding protein
MGRRAVAMAVALGVAAACTGGGLPRPTASPSASPAPTPHRGGEAVFGYQIGAECLNPITECAAGVYAHFIVLEHVLPRAMQLDAHGNFVASPLLVEAPSLANGGLTENPFTVRFRISPEAVWDDRSPITSADFSFTWRANLNTRHKGVSVAYRAEAYMHVIAVDDSDPRVAVIRFDDVYVDWPDLFGGRFDYVLKATAFPKADPDAPNLSEEMFAIIPFSGGPFRLESWNPDRAVLVRNQHYFGTQAQLDRVTFISPRNVDPITALIQGKVSAITPEVWSMPPVDHAAIPNVDILGGNSPFYEVLWLNHRTPPLDDPKVREALMYAIDRQVLIDALVKEWNPDAAILNCGLIALPDVGPWCRTQPFAQFTYDPDRARSILEEDGFDCSGKACTKDGMPLTVEYLVHDNDVRRKLSQQLLLEKARDAGFDFDLKTYSHFFDLRKFPLAQYAVEGSPEPSVTARFACDQIGLEGSNFIGWCDQEADRLMKMSDRELDPKRRLALLEQVYELEADDFVSLPLYVIPALSAWRTDMIAGPIGTWNGSPYGMFFNMGEWYLP